VKEGEMSKGDRSKLPKWAQQEFETLEMRNAELQEKLQQAVEGDSSNRLFQQVAGVGTIFGAELPIIGRQVIARVGQDDAETPTIWMQVKQDSKDRSYVELMAVSESLVVQPQSSNVVRVYAERRF
jgi:hypothetical protein